MTVRFPFALALILPLLVVSGCGDDEDPPSSAGAGGQGAETAAGAEDDGGCREAEAPAPKPEGGATEPSAPLDKGKRYRVTFETSCGRFTVAIDQATSPQTAASFVALVRSGFFDGTTFHRIVPGFVIQGGDPTGTGTGGPGYSTVDPPPADAAYTRGVVAMAKTAAEDPGTAGSQFYVVTGADAALPPEYALLGKVVSGLDVTARIEAQGDPAAGGEGVPLRPVVVDRVSVSER